MKRAGLKTWLCLLLLAFPARSRAQDPARPLDYCVHPNGEVFVTDAGRGIADIHPYIFTGAYGGAYWNRSIVFRAAGPEGEKNGFNASALVGGLKVDMRYEVKPLPDGLRIHYRLVPRQEVKASLVEIYALYPYADWLGAPMNFDGEDTTVPGQPTPMPGSASWLIRQADSKTVSIGPSAALGGLAFRMTSPGMKLQISDNRYYDKNLAVIYSHGESGDDWTWAQGEAKDFDFNLTFNRPMAGVPCATPAPAQPPVALLAVPTATPTPVLPPGAGAEAVPVQGVGNGDRFRPTPTPPPPAPVPAGSSNPGRVHAPANLYVTFADGPGRYRVDVVDGKGDTLVSLYDRRVVVEGGAWLEWDGRDGKGNKVPPGRYDVVVYRNGKALNRLAVVR